MNELIRYFTNLLILQYRNKPKAKATIETLATNLFSNDTGGIFPLDVENAYDLDNASQKQLDVIGKYIGYSSDVDIIVDNNFKYAEYDDSVNPDTGYSEYNGSKESLPYAEYRYTTYLKKILEYGDYTKILGFLSEIKNSVLSLGEIDSLLKKYFGDDIYVVEGDKTVEYHFLQEFLPDFTTEDQLDVFVQKYMPKPMGCAISAERDPFYLNLEPIGGAEDYIDENFVYTRETQSNTTYLKTFKGFNVKRYDDFEIQIKVRFDSSYTSCDFYYTAIDGDNEDFNKKYDFGLEKRRLTSSFALINKNSQGQVQYIDIVGYNNYVNDWVILKLTRQRGETSSGSLILTIIVNGETVDTVDSYWGMEVLENAYFVFGSNLIGSVDFKECWIKINGELVWKGITNKRPKGV